MKPHLEHPGEFDCGQGPLLPFLCHYSKDSLKQARIPQILQQSCSEANTTTVVLLDSFQQLPGVTVWNYVNVKQGFPKKRSLLSVELAKRLKRMSGRPICVL